MEEVYYKSMTRKNKKIYPLLLNSLFSMAANTDCGIRMTQRGAFSCSIFLYLYLFTFFACTDWKFGTS
jgi:predicted metalloprotease